jgi:3-methyladenine DNA glycosylase AlkD
MRTLANPARAAALQRFFKTAPGEYGAGDRFLGLTMPEVRRLARQYADTSLAQLERLLESPWHEVRMLALVIMVQQFRRADEEMREALYRVYLRRTDRINNWDLVDVTAPGVVGAYLLSRPRSVLRRLARSANVWERRIAIISTFAFLRAGDHADSLALATMLLHDSHDLIHKAVGWTLREVGKHDERVLRQFLDRHSPSMPRTMLRYAIERLPASARRTYLGRPRPSGRAGANGSQEERGHGDTG